MDTKKPAGVVDCTPKWAEAVNIFKVLLGPLGNDKTRPTAWEEIERMAKLADQRNDMARLLAEVVTMSPRTFKLMKGKAARLLAVSQEARS